MALNNMGVSLLTRGQYNDAIMAFGDAIALISQVSNCTFGESLPALVQAKLERASRALARCALDVSTNIVKNDNKASTKYCVISQDDCAATCRSCLQTEDTGTVFLIRLERTAKSIPADTKERYFAGFESSIILYNCANAHLCCGSWARPNHEQTIVVDSALSILQHSSSILEQIMKDDDASEHLPLAMIVLRLLVLVPWIFGVAFDAGGYFSDLVHLQEKFLLLDSPTWLQHIAAGAA
jgi:hypothetical protein